nr:hypothetical protein [Tanacetum cinerariifolium]
MRCGSGLWKGICLICKQHFLNTSPSISSNSSQSPPQISKHCCYGCGNPLEGIFCHQCTCELCGHGAHYGYNCPPKVPIFPDPEPFNHHTINELPPTVQSFDPKSDLVYSPLNVFSPSLQPPSYSYEFCGNDAYYGQDCSLQVPFTYDPEPFSVPVNYALELGYIENYNSYLYDSSSVSQQYPCCTRCGGPHETYQCD